jgi:hypothetical protein
MRSGIHIIEDVVHTCVYAPDLAYLVVGGESPELVALAVAIDLIIALAGESAIES